MGPGPSGFSRFQMSNRTHTGLTENTLRRIALLLVPLLLSTSVQAQRFNKKPDYAGLRDGAWEASLLIGNQSSASATADNGASLDLDSEFFSGDRADLDFDTLNLEAGLMW